MEVEVNIFVFVFEYNLVNFVPMSIRLLNDKSLGHFYSILYVSVYIPM